jgi:hypothetical protein
MCGMNERMTGEEWKRSSEQSDVARHLVSSRKLHGTTDATDVRRTCVADRLGRKGYGVMRVASRSEVSAR